MKVSHGKTMVQYIVDLVTKFLRGFGFLDLVDRRLRYHNNFSSIRIDLQGYELSAIGLVGSEPTRPTVDNRPLIYERTASPGDVVDMTVS